MGTKVVAPLPTPEEMRIIPNPLNCMRQVRDAAFHKSSQPQCHSNNGVQAFTVYFMRHG